MKVYVKLFGVDKYRLLGVDKNEDGEWTDCVRAKQCREKDYGISKIASTIICDELLRGNVIIEED